LSLPENIDVHLDATVDFLVGLLEIPSPTGYHTEAIDYVRRAFEDLAIPGLSLTLTGKGALLARWPGRAPTAPIGITAHIDTLGFMVKEIKNSGRLRLTNLGGILWGGVESEGVTVRTFDDRRIRGSIHPANTSVHVNRQIHNEKRTIDNMEIRLDERTTSASETRDLGIEVGDFVFVDPRVEVTESGFIRARFLDDKAGVAALYGALRALHEAGLQPVQDTYILIANYEEVGHGGSAGLPPELAELVVVDMGAIGGGQTGDEFSVSICAKDAGGPYHFDLTNKLRRIARQHDIPHNIDIYIHYSSDGTAYWRAGGDARVGLVGPGVDASHSYERTHRESILHTAHLLAQYMLHEEE
jgi:putative aminopeptidase FrvX